MAHPGFGARESSPSAANAEVEPPRATMAGKRSLAEQALAAKGGGAPLPQPVLDKMQAAFGADFSSVRVHVDDAAAKVGARAFTRGDELHFAPGQYDPDSAAGQELIGHELAHVVQQREGRVAAPAQAAGLAVNDDAGLEREADDHGARAAAGQSVGRSTSAASSASSAGPAPLKAWEWRGQQWHEVDANEKGKSVPGDVRGDADGEVYDADTEKWYQSVAKYRQYTARIDNPPFKAGPGQDIFDLMAIKGAPVKAEPGAHSKLESFLTKGVRTPGDLGDSATTSADEKSRPDQISVNRVGPFASREDAEGQAAYASNNPANGAIPVVLENGADRIAPDQQPDLGALAQRAHNSALAIIDPSGLSPDMQMAIKLSEGTGEIGLSSSIPASNFVTLLVPVQLQHCLSQELIARFKIRFVGSRDARVQYNYKTTAMKSEAIEVVTQVPDYQAALADIFDNNRGSILLTHVIRMSPKVSLATKPRDEAQGVEAVASSSMPHHEAVPSHEPTPHHKPPSHEPTPHHEPSHDNASGVDPSSVAPGRSARDVANVVREHYEAAYSVEDTPLTSAADLQVHHQADGVTQSNADAVWAVLADDGFWFC